MKVIGNKQSGRKFFGSKWSFTTELIFAFSFVIIPMIIILIIGIYYLNDYMKNRVYELVKNNTEQKMSLLSKEFYSNNFLLYQIVSDDDIIENTIMLVEDDNTKNHWKYKSDMKEAMSMYGYLNDAIANILVITKEGAVVNFETNPLALDATPVKTDINNNELYMESSRLFGKNKAYYLVGENPNTTKYDNNDYIYYTGQSIYKLLPNIEFMGIGAVGYHENYLEELCNENNTTDMSYCFIVDSEGSIITHRDKTMLRANISSYYGDNDLGSVINRTDMEPFVNEVAINDVKNIACGIRIPGTDWILVNMFDYNHVFENVIRFKWISILVLLFAVSVVYLLINRITKSMSHSINELVEVMGNARNGEMIRYSNDEPRNEIDIISKSYNKMLNEMHELMIQKETAIRKEKDAEIKALEAQINPHFMYNTLDSINWIAIKNEQFEISNIINKLSNILRYSISKKNTIVTIREELIWMDNYLSLQKYRFSDTFDYKIHAGEDIMDFMVHKLLLQPLIENAVIHGVAEMQGNGFIEILVEKTQEGEYLRFVINDNGKGLPAEEANKIFSADSQQVSAIGIRNVIERLDLYYKGKSKIEVSSSPGSGLKLSVYIPFFAMTS